MKNNKLQVLTFLYHEVVSAPEDSGFQRKSALPYKHGIEEFEENINIIVRNSEEITTIDKIEEYQGQKVTLLAFDDGGKSAMHIAEVLEKHHVRGHFFITTSLIGDKYFLDKKQIIDLHNRGHIIGSHSHLHPNVFKSLSHAEMLKEWSESKRILEEILKTTVDTCSIPGGDDNEDTYTSAYETGYKYIFNSDPTTKLTYHKDMMIIGRICPKTGTDYSKIESLSKYKGIKTERFKRVFKNTVKSLIFPIYSKIHNSSKHEGKE